MTNNFIKKMFPVCLILGAGSGIGGNTTRVLQIVDIMSIFAEDLIAKDSIN